MEKEKDDRMEEASDQETQNFSMPHKTEVFTMDKNYIYLECDIGKTSIMKFLVDTGASI